jgi:SNF2 family DNA or RNA helicase
MDESFLKKYIQIETEVDASIVFVSMRDPYKFFAGIRVALLKLDESPKIDYVVGNIPSLVSSGKKVVVFTNFVANGVKLLQTRLREKGVYSEYISAEISIHDRQTIVRKYNSGAIKVLIMAPAGGEGLHLTETNSVFVLDPPWNDAKLKQSIGRVVRYHSHKNLPLEEQYVKVYYLENIKPDKYSDGTDVKGQLKSADTFLYDMILKKRDKEIRMTDIISAFSIENRRC